ncbi:MAG: DUF6750 family protein [Gammaproteobacteria bacterium]
MKKILKMLFLSFLSVNTTGYAAGLGDVMGNIVGPVTGLGHMMNGVCYVIGLGFLLVGLLQYKYHRENPQQIKISTPIILVLLGVIMIALPFIAMMSESGQILK